MSIIHKLLLDVAMINVLLLILAMSLCYVICTLKWWFCIKFL